MRPTPVFKPNETFEQMRQRMLDDTARFIEWGLQHPEKIDRIPRHAVGEGAFTDRIRRIFWTIALRNEDRPD